MTSLFLFRYRCNDGTVYQHWLEEDQIPKVCEKHPEEAVNAQIIDSRIANVVSITDDSAGTLGRFRSEGFLMNIKPKSQGSTVEEISWPYYNVSVTNIGYLGEDENKDDVIHMATAPNTLIGYLIAPVEENSNVFRVNSTALNNSNVANQFKLKDSNGNIEDLGEIIGIDYESSEVTTERKSVKNYNPGTLVLTEFVRIKNVPLNSAKNMIFGAYSAGNSFVPKGTKVSIIYDNKEEKEKKFRFYTEMRV